MNHYINEPNKALEPMRLLVTPTACAVVAPSNRMAQFERSAKIMNRSFFPMLLVVALGGCMFPCAQKPGEMQVLLSRIAGENLERKEIIYRESSLISNVDEFRSAVSRELTDSEWSVPTTSETGIIYIFRKGGDTESSELIYARLGVRDLRILRTSDLIYGTGFDWPYSLEKK